jgi:predicted secreted protein
VEPPPSVRSLIANSRRQNRIATPRDCAVVTIILIRSVILIISTIIFSTVSSPLFSQDSFIKLYTERSFDPKKTIQMAVGEKVFVILEKSGGTGYFWDSHVEDNKVVRTLFIETGSAKEPSDPGIVGALESDMFRIDAIAPGNALITFDLRRARSDAVRSISVKLTIGG